MKPSDFHIGMEFWSDGGHWRCTDVGVRTIARLFPRGAATASLSRTVEIEPFGSKVPSRGGGVVKLPPSGASETP